MKCPVCESPSSVVDTRFRANGFVIRRRRECDLGHRWTTDETAREGRDGVEDTNWSALVRLRGALHRRIDERLSA